jgi:hypothetical protein
VGWIDLAPNRDQFWALVNTLLKFRDPKIAYIFLLHKQLSASQLYRVSQCINHCADPDTLLAVG